MRYATIVFCFLIAATTALAGQNGSGDERFLQWDSLPDLPNELGVAGPFAGVHNDALIVAGGANFAEPVWENDKVWHDEIHVLMHSASGYRWKSGGKLPRRIAYGAAVSTPDGGVCMGGGDEERVYSDVFLLSWDPKAHKVSRTDYPPLPRPCAYGQAVVIGKVIYLAGGQCDTGLESAMANFWAESYRSVGSLANAFSITRSSEMGSSTPSERGVGGSLP